MDDRITCQACGAEQPATARYCRLCGGTLSGEVPPRSGFESIALLELRLNDIQRHVEEIDRRLRLVEAGAPSAPAARVTTPVSPPVPRSATRVEPIAPATAAGRDGAIRGEPGARPPDPPPVGAAAPAQAAATVAPPRRIERPSPASVKTPRDWEQFLSGQGMAIVGGLAIVIGTIFFLSLAFSRGWIGPEARVLIGGGAAVVLLAAGWRQFSRKLPVMAHVLTAVGMGVMMLSLFAATRLYDLIPAELGLLGSLVTATAAALIAIRFDSRVVAAYGIVSALAAPPILGADANGTTIAFMTTALAGTSVIALHRTWVWLPHLAFALSVPQLANWVAIEAPVSAGAVALGGFWLLHAVAAGGEEFRRPTGRLRRSSALLLGANSLTAVGLTYPLFDFGSERGMPLMLFALAAAHLALGGRFLASKGDRHPFGMLATGGGIAVALLAISEQFDSVVVAAAWTAVAVLVAWFAARLRNPYGAAAAGVAGLLTFAHLWIFEYPLARLFDEVDRARPFVHAEGLTAAAVLAALAFAGWIGRRRDVRLVTLLAGTALIVTALPHELSGPALLVAWSALLTIGALVGRNQGRLGAPADRALPGGFAPWIPAAVAAILALAHTWTVVYPLARVADPVDRARPFLHADGLAAGFMLAAFVAAGWIARTRGARVLLLLGGTAAVASVLPHELSGMALLAAWSGLILLGAAVERFDAILGREERSAERWSAPMALVSRAAPAVPWLTATTLAAGHLIRTELPLERLLTAEWVRPDRPFANEGTAGALLVAAASVAAVAILRRIELRRASGLVAIATLAYLMPFQLGPAATVVAWSALAAAACALARWDGAGAFVYRTGMGMLLSAGFLWTITAIAPPERLTVDGGPMPDQVPLWSAATAALGALAAALAFASRQERHPARRGLTATLAAALAIYLLSVGVVDHFQQQTGGGVELDALQKRAQVGLSILWAVTGGAIFALGALMERRRTRVFALALLGLATGKVFILDLASLNASYRVPSFIALGVLLLASSYVYQRHRARSRHDEEPHDDERGGPHPLNGAAETPA